MSGHGAGWAVRSRAWEETLRALGYYRIAGLDEAGRGALAGPVVAAAVVLPDEFESEGIDDSKRLTPAQRDAAYDRIMAGALGVGIGIVPHDEIDRVNILEATKLAMRDAAASIRPSPDFLLTDAVVLPVPCPVWGLIKGDRRVLPIAAASIIAKVTRDRLMIGYHAHYPAYGFAVHKGYGTPVHLAQLRRLGACAIHRMSFQPVVNVEDGGTGRSRAAQDVPTTGHAADRVTKHGQ